MRWIVYDLFCLAFAMRNLKQNKQNKQNKSGGTQLHVTREQAQWLASRNVNPGDYFRAAMNVPAHERRALAIRMAEEADERAIALKEERKAHEWAAIQYEECAALVNEIVESDPEHRGALRLQLGELYGEVGEEALAEAEKSAQAEAREDDEMWHIECAASEEAWDAEIASHLQAEEAEESARIAMAMAKARDSRAGTIVIITERERALDRVEVPADAPHAAAINAKLKAESDAALAAEIGLNLPNV